MPRDPVPENALDLQAYLAVFDTSGHSTSRLAPPTAGVVV
jgi:hypothetical protein